MKVRVAQAWVHPEFLNPGVHYSKRREHAILVRLRDQLRMFL